MLYRRRSIRNCGVSVSAADGMFAAYGTLSRSLAMRHHARMQANAVSQRVAWMLVARPLNDRLSDAVSAHVAPRRCTGRGTGPIPCNRFRGCSATGIFRSTLVMFAGADLQLAPKKKAFGKKTCGLLTWLQASGKQTEKAAVWPAAVKLVCFGVTTKNTRGHINADLWAVDAFEIIIKRHVLPSH